MEHSLSPPLQHPSSLAAGRWVSKVSSTLRHYSDCTWINSDINVTSVRLGAHAFSGFAAMPKTSWRVQQQLCNAIWKDIPTSSKEQQDTDYFLWISRKYFQFPEDQWVEGVVTGRSQILLSAIFLKRSYYFWKLFLENRIAQDFPLGLLKSRGDIEAGWSWQVEN